MVPSRKPYPAQLGFARREHAEPPHDSVAICNHDLLGFAAARKIAGPACDPQHHSVAGGRRLRPRHLSFAPIMACERKAFGQWPTRQTSARLGEHAPAVSAQPCDDSVRTLWFGNQRGSRQVVPANSEQMHRAHVVQLNAAVLLVTMFLPKVGKQRRREQHDRHATHERAPIIPRFTVSAQRTDPNRDTNPEQRRPGGITKK